MSPTAKLEQMIVRRAMRWYWAHTKSQNGNFYKAGLRPYARISLWAACAQLANLDKK